MGITHSCFALSYLLALILTWAANRRWSGRVAAVCVAAGLVAHTAFLLIHQPSSATAYGSLLLLGWLLAVSELLVLTRSQRRAWSQMILPLLVAVVGLARAMPPRDDSSRTWLAGESFWGAVHGGLFLLAAVAVAIGFVASILYLVQASRLRRKLQPLPGMRRLSLESLERANRRAANIAFPLLTLGLLLGAMQGFASPIDWGSVKFLATIGSWTACGLLTYLRYRAHLPGRRLAWVTVATFFVMLLSLVASHPSAAGAHL